MVKPGKKLKFVGKKRLRPRKKRKKPGKERKPTMKPPHPGEGLDTYRHPRLDFSLLENLADALVSTAATARNIAGEYLQKSQEYLKGVEDYLAEGFSGIYERLSDYLQLCRAYAYFDNQKHF
ncbi:hypothetical protein GF386_04985 [Candidatus Pacearchaeota archaeon]|nr:hypothetical protein [Candidatus Pacearchaeota archaeon]MBD3283468.1 hypothetical protein [Candidatus Pacearchaeota archaeon]